MGKLNILKEKKKVIFCSTVFFIIFTIISTINAEAERFDKRKFFPEPHKVFWKGIITLKVSSFDKAREEAIEIAKKYGGNSYSEEIKVNNNGRKHGEIQIRIPVEQKYDFINDVHKLGTIYSQKISAPDVTEEFVDLTRRLTNLQAEEKQLLDVLKKARHVLEVLQVQSHLFNVRIEIERITTRHNEIVIKSETALFTLSFFEPEAIVEPVSPGGIEGFIPRWWQYSALPNIKKQVKNTYYVFTSMLFNYIFGLKGSVPNLIIIGIFVIVFLIFYISVWPVLKKNLSGVLGDLKNRDVPVFKIIIAIIFLYLCYVTIPVIATPLLFFFIYLWILGYFETETVKSALSWMDKKGIKAGWVYLILAIPLIISIFQTLFPQIWVQVQQTILSIIPLTILAGIIIILVLIIKILLKEKYKDLFNKYINNEVKDRTIIKEEIPAEEEIQEGEEEKEPSGIEVENI